MKIFSGALLLGVCLLLGTAYYPWPMQHPLSSRMGEMLMNKSISAPATRVDYYKEIKFWAEKTGQILAGVGTIGTLITQWKRRKK